MEQNPSSSRADRKTVEKNRRNQMKTLFSQLISLVPHHCKEPLSLPDQIGEATNYIKNMQIKLEKLKERKDSAMGARLLSNDAMGGSFRVPHVDVQEIGSALQVFLITGPESQFLFTETLRLLREEGVEVVNASFSVVDNAIFYTVHSEIGEYAPSTAAARISERLRKRVYGGN